MSTQTRRRSVFEQRSRRAAHLLDCFRVQVQSAQGFTNPCSVLNSNNQVLQDAQATQEQSQSSATPTALTAQKRNSQKAKFPLFYMVDKVPALGHSIHNLLMGRLINCASTVLIRVVRANRYLAFVREAEIARIFI